MFKRDLDIFHKMFISLDILLIYSATPIHKKRYRTEHFIFEFKTENVKMHKLPMVLKTIL